MTASRKLPGILAHLIRAFGDRIAPCGTGDGRLCIVNYHRILETADPLLDSEPDIQTFHWQMQLLAEGFNVMPLHEAVMAMPRGRMPPRAVCITFDDGYRSTYDLALPVLKEFGLPATVFVTTGHMDKDNMWNDRILDAIRCCVAGPIDLTSLRQGVHYVDTDRDRKRLADQLTSAVKYLPPAERLDIIENFERLIGRAPSHRLMLTGQMVRDLASQGVEIGGHTISHPILTTISEQAARHEIVGGKENLEAVIRQPLRLFAYPNGKAGVDFDERHVQMVKDAGFVAAFTTASGAASMRNDRYQLPRSRPWDTTPVMFSARLLHWLMG